jgi:radical SAM superfamily enzyme YgiQ (UPF0313 family)
VGHSSPRILLINPWITDFAAYNFWIKPIGLLHIASLLRKNGFQVTLIDCLDFYSKTKQYGDGNFFKTWIQKPKRLESIPRHYSRYGIPEGLLTERVSSAGKPDLVGITSGMTYWYPGVFEVIKIIRQLFSDMPIILGGIYATLCYEHAGKYSGADYVVKGRGEVEGTRLISALTGSIIPSDPEFLRNCYPAFDLYPRLGFVCIATSRGCPLRCTYCASHILYNGFDRRDPDEVVREIEHWVVTHRVHNVAFYDDALLIKPRDHIVPILKEIIKRGIQCYFHTPNGLHIREIDEALADLLYRAGFKTLRLGFETSHAETQVETGGKVENQEFVGAVRCLKRAGYSGDEIGVYIMVGLPGQRVEETEESIAFVQETGARPILVEYSPIPHTSLFEKAKQSSRYDLENEPLYQNNSILPCQWEGFTMADYRRLKEGIRR